MADVKRELLLVCGLALFVAVAPIHLGAEQSDGARRALAAAAAKGSAPAQYALGAAAESDGDAETAARWFTEAAQNGYAAAQFKLGELLEAGRGVPANKETALEWYRKAAAQDFAAAKSRLETLDPPSAGPAGEPVTTPNDVPAVSVGSDPPPTAAAPPAAVEPSTVSVAEMMAVYERDKRGADFQFKNVRVRVRDSARELRESVLVLGSPGRGQDVVRCRLSPDAVAAWRHLTVGAVVTVEGFGKGRGILGNVTLDGCHVVDGPPPAAPVSSPSRVDDTSVQQPDTVWGWTSNTVTTVVGTLLVCALLWAANRFLRRRCPNCKGTKYRHLAHDEIDRWIGTKTVRDVTTAQHQARPAPGEMLRHAGTTTITTQHEVPVTKVKYRDVFQCDVCDKPWEEVSTAELS